MSGKRYRYKKDGFNLDLTYITPRVVGMSFPAHSIKEKVYRNDIDVVVKFFQQKHNNNYKVYNMSNKEVRRDKFEAAGG